MVSAEFDFTVLPNPVDIGFVGTGSALGAVLVGLFEYFVRVSPLEQTAQRSALGGLAFGAVALCVWASGLMGVPWGE